MSEDNKANRVNKSTYKTRYPYNQVQVTRSGHEIHYDDTPGAERIRFAHKDGSYIEINPGGKVVQFTVGHQQSYNKGGVTLTIDENNDVKIHGHQRLNVSGGSHITVAGDADVVCGGGMNTVVGGDMKAAVAGDGYIGVAGNGNMHINGQMALSVEGSMTMDVAGDTTMTTGGTHTIKAGKIDLNP